MAGGVPLRVEPLASHHSRDRFISGVPALDRYFRTQAGQDVRKHLAALFVLLGEADQVLGYYTLSASSILLTELPENITKRLPHYPLIPAILLGRLAVDQSQQGRGLGRFLLADALHRASRADIAAYAVIVDAKDDVAATFYVKEGFTHFPGRPLKLFLPMATIRALFA
ncbi:GNAT family N-acetyltransferase [Niveispirillum irakense]|uniref:GNAT family N-acetyltransferase n=1 Tax=Niveispirillum irakense TaxID=34011 RepID=UPI00048C07CE|nr:GNAT family N-acetyltransferase [Niveispirillum irakense]